MWMENDYYGKLADVQTTFLHRDLLEEIFIEIPEGYEEYIMETYEKKLNTDYLKLEKSSYRLV